MDQTPLADVLLETVETVPQAGGATAQAGRLGTAGRSDGAQPQELLAFIQNDGDTVGPERLMAEITRLGLDSRTMDYVSLPGNKSVRVACPVTG